MKVYVLIQHSEQPSEILDVFDTLAKAQYYRGCKPEDWTTDLYNKGWWDGLGKVFNLSIVEWEVK
jgi:hypothetical protein